MPAFVFPQLVLCGVFAPRDTMARGLQWIADAVPMTYAYDGLQRVAVGAEVTGGVARDVVIVIGCAVLALLLGSATLRRRTA
jgi:ABC-2 type transport system permease protein